MRCEQHQSISTVVCDAFTWQSEDADKLSRREAVINELRGQLADRVGLAKRPDRLYRLRAILNG